MMKKLNPKVKKMWVKELRSGEYVQTSTVLCRVSDRYDKFCCLGVLTDLAIRKGVPGVYWVGDDENYTLRTSGRALEGDGESYTSRETNKWAGLNTAIMKKCAVWNDDDGLNFEQIADKIESEL